MTEMIIDLSNYKDRVGARVTPGKYRVQVEDVESGTSSNKNPMINLWLRITGDSEFEGQTIVDRLTLTENSMFRVVGFMSAIGLPTPKKRLKINIQQFVGKTLDIVVDDGEPWNGRVKSEVRAYERVVKSGAESNSGNDLDDLEGLGEFAAPGTVDVTHEDTSSTATDLPTDDTDDVPAAVDLDEIEL